MALAVLLGVPVPSTRAVLPGPAATAAATATASAAATAAAADAAAAITWSPVIAKSVVPVVDRGRRQLCG